MGGNKLHFLKKNRQQKKYIIEIKQTLSFFSERASVNVCFWDAMAEKFNDALEEIEEFPTIIIIASAKITSWQPARQNSK